MSQAKFVVTPLAQSDIESARFWYEGQQAGLGARFLTDAARHLSADSSKSACCGFAMADVRHAMVRVFPFVVYYTFDDDEVVIHCVIHASRDQSEWQRRF